jgi:DNA-binding beta-propeller fold protein YncE
MRRWLILPWLLCLTTLTLAQGGLYNLPQPYADPVSTSGSIALTRAGRIISTQPLSNTVSIIGLDGSLEAEFELDGARGVVILPDNLRALAVGEARVLQINLNDNSVQTLLEATGGAFIVADDEQAYLSQPERAQVLAFNLDNPADRQIIPTPADPAGLALWGDFLYVTHERSGQFSLIYRPSGEVVRTIQPTANGTQARSVALDAIQGVAYLPLSRANPATDYTDNRFVPLVAVIDLRTLQITRLINLIVADRYLSQPVAAALNQNRTELVIAHAGSDSLTVIDIASGTAAAHLQTDAAPHGVAFNRAFTRLYASSRVENSVTVHNTRFFALDDVLPATDTLLSPALRLGARLYHTADKTVSCAGCHHDGSGDGREWFGADTPPLSAPYDPAFLESHMQQVQPNRPALDSVEVQALVAYLEQLASD